MLKHESYGEFQLKFSLLCEEIVAVGKICETLHNLLETDFMY